VGEGAEQTVTLWTAIKFCFYVLMHVFNVLLKFKNMFICFFIYKLMFLTSMKPTIE